MDSCRRGLFQRAAVQLQIKLVHIVAGLLVVFNCVPLLLGCSVRGGSSRRWHVLLLLLGIVAAGHPGNVIIAKNCQVVVCVQLQVKVIQIVVDSLVVVVAFFLCVVLIVCRNGGGGRG